MDHNFTFDFIDVEIPDFNPEFFALWLNEVVSYYNKEAGELCYVFCSDEYLLEMNNEHLDHDYYTDIITFNYNEGVRLNGDFFISWDRVQENAKDYGDGIAFNELCRVMVHGVLHLIGYNDKTDEDELVMREQEDLCLQMRNGFT